jgi:hypothetical protein
MSSGNTCQNNKAIAKQMIDSIKAIDTGKHEIILKWQLSLPDGINEPLEHGVFNYAYHYGIEQGYKTTSSVADLESLKFLLQYDIPFVKLPNCRELDYLIDYIPRGIKVYVSVGPDDIYDDGVEHLKGYGIVDKNMVFLSCISKYPATKEDYGWEEEKDYFSMRHGYYLYNQGLSDHTTNWDLYHATKYHYFLQAHAWFNDITEREKWAKKTMKDRIFEWHFKLPDSVGLDSGPFARTPDELREIL